MDFPCPRVVLSKCLEIDACRYNAQLIRSPAVRRLSEFVDFVPVCPEVEVGLGTPRDPIRLVEIGGGTRLIQPSTSLDVTEAMHDFGDRWLSEVGEIDGFILKSRSPSCGIDAIKVYGSPDSGPPIGKGVGLFAESVLERFPSTLTEHEGRLTNLAIRDHFFTGLFAHASLRAVGETGRMSELVAFQARQKLALMACSPSAQTELGRIVANPSRRPFSEVFGSYREIFRDVIRVAPGPGAHQNVLQHAQGYFKTGLSTQEKAHFGGLLSDYRSGRVGRAPLLTLLQSWVHRFDESYLAAQSYLNPYPRPLLDLGDSGGG